MSRRRDVAIAAAAVALAIALFLIARPTLGASRPDPACSWSPATVAAGETSTLTGVELPDEYVVLVIPTGVAPHPSGEVPGPDPFVRDYRVDEPLTAWFITRGGPYPAVYRFGRQMNDYKAVAKCSVEVIP